MNKETIKYKDWQTGREVERKLSSSFPAEQINKNNLKCPYDNTLLIFWYDEMYKGLCCPNCETEYSRMNLGTKEELAIAAQEILEEKKRELTSLDSSYGKLERFVKFAEASLKRKEKK